MLSNVHHGVNTNTTACNVASAKPWKMNESGCAYAQRICNDLYLGNNFNHDHLIYWQSCANNSILRLHWPNIFLGHIGQYKNRPERILDCSNILAIDRCLFRIKSNYFECLLSCLFVEFFTWIDELFTGRSIVIFTTIVTCFKMVISGKNLFSCQFDLISR